MQLEDEHSGGVYVSQLLPFHEQPLVFWQSVWPHALQLLAEQDGGGPEQLPFSQRHPVVLVQAFWSQAPQSLDVHEGVDVDRQVEEPEL